MTLDQHLVLAYPDRFEIHPSLGLMVSLDAQTLLTWEEYMKFKTAKTCRGKEYDEGLGL